MRHRLLMGVLALLLMHPSWVLGHQDDPKVNDRVPPYSGPGFRASAFTSGAQPFGPGVPVFPASGVQLLAWVPLSDISPQLTNGADCWGYVAPSGREYALFGHSHGMTVFEVTQPGDPVLLATIPGIASLWRDVKVYGHHAYVGTEGVGGNLQVVDLAQVDLGLVTLVNTISTGGSSRTHNIAIDEVSGFLYRCGGDNNGLRVYDLANPASPVHVASWPDRYVHDAQIVTYTTGIHAGKQIAFCGSGFNGGWASPGIDILDVTDKANIIQLSRTFYPNAWYSHQVWLSEDRHYLYVNDEIDEQQLGLLTTTIVIDVGNLASPGPVTTFTNGSTAVGHNLYTDGNLLFEANYRSGLRVFDATNPLAPTEVAYFDTWPPDDAANFNGLWNVYPYLPSGVLIGSDLEKGLFLWYLGSVASDCNANGVDDGVELQLGISGDCNGNTIPDPCDLVTGVLVDLDANGLADSCGCPNPFLRGDVSGDGMVNVADAVFLLGALFGTGPGLTGFDAADANGDDLLDVSDPIRLLGTLFGQDPPLPPPFPNPGCE